MQIAALLTALGIDAKRKQGKWIARCPNPKHADNSPSWTIIDRGEYDRKSGSHHCFSCSLKGGPWELAAAVWKIPVEAAGARLNEIFGGPRSGSSILPKIEIRIPKKQVGYELPIGVTIPGPGGKWSEPYLRYLTERGVTQEQIDRWGFGYALRGKLRQRVVLPVWTEGALRTFSARAIVPDIHRYEAGQTHRGAQPRRAVWGEPGFNRRLGAVTVAEGIFSALALERAGAINPAALLGSELTPERARVLAGFEVVIIATDPDDAGEKVAKNLFVFKRRATVVRLEFEKSPDDLDSTVLRDLIQETNQKLGLTSG